MLFTSITNAITAISIRVYTTT